MGNGFSETRPQLGYHILKVQPNSPGSAANFDSHFDFIVRVGEVVLDKEDETLVNILKENMNKKIKMTIYSSKTDQLRDVDVIPTDNWGGSGLLGVSIRFCSFYGVYENIYHVLHVHKNSPASEAQLQQYSDYIVGTPDVLFNDTEDFSKLLKTNINKPITIYVYNSQSLNIREVSLTPRDNWGGDGLIGCDIGVGLLHRIPTSKVVQTPTPQPQVNQDYKMKLNELEQKFNDLSTTKQSPPSNVVTQPTQPTIPTPQTQYTAPTQPTQPTQPVQPVVIQPVPIYTPPVQTQPPVQQKQPTQPVQPTPTPTPTPTPVVTSPPNNTTTQPNILGSSPPSSQKNTVVDDDMPPSDDQLESKDDVSSLFGDSKSEGFDIFSNPNNNNSPFNQEFASPTTPNNTPVIPQNQPTQTTIPVPNFKDIVNNTNPTVNPTLNPTTPVQNPTTATPQNTPNTQAPSNVDFKQKLEELKRKMQERMEQNKN